MPNDVATTAVLAAVGEIVEARGKTREVTLDQRLVHDLELDSMDLAELVAVLDGSLQVEPFTTGAAIADIRTVGDLAAVYRAALG